MIVVSFSSATGCSSHTCHARLQGLVARIVPVAVGSAPQAPPSPIGPGRDAYPVVASLPEGHGPNGKIPVLSGQIGRCGLPATCRQEGTGHEPPERTHLDTPCHAS